MPDLRSGPKTAFEAAERRRHPSRMPAERSGGGLDFEVAVASAMETGP